MHTGGSSTLQLWHAGEASSHHPLCSLLFLPRRRCALKVRGCHLSTACGPQQSTSGISTSTWPSPSRADCWSLIFRRRRWCRWVEQVSGLPEHLRTPEKLFNGKSETDFIELLRGKVKSQVSPNGRAAPCVAAQCISVQVCEAEALDNNAV